MSSKATAESILVEIGQASRYNEVPRPPRPEDGIDLACDYLKLIRGESSASPLRAAARKIAVQILEDTTTIPFSSWEMLARVYLNVTAKRTTLGDLGEIKISRSALAIYARDQRLDLGDAQRELADLLRWASQKPDGRWITRRKLTNLDITVRVVADQGCQVVEHLRVRTLNVGRRRED